MSQQASILKRKPFFVFFSVLLLGLLVYVLWIRSLNADPIEVKVYGQSKIQANKVSSFQVYLRNASSQQAQANAEVQWQLLSAQGDVITESKVKTDPKGFAQIQLKAPKKLKQGEYKLKVLARSTKGQNQVEKTVRYRRSYRLLITTDKPLYQPGQTIHIRTLALSSFDNQPAQKQKVQIEVHDGKKNKIFKQQITSSEYGLASVDVPLATLVNKGRYEIHAQISDTKSEHSVQVKNYTLPRFKIDLKANKGFYAPGDTVNLRLHAKYTFGKPVAKAKVTIQRQNTIQQLGLQKQGATQITGETDKNGFLETKVQVDQILAGTPLHGGDATVRFLATVRDKSGQELRKSISVLVTSKPIRVSVITESARLVDNLENVLYFVVTDPKGAPVQTTLTVEEHGVKGWTRWEQAHQVTTSKLGIAKLTLKPLAPRSYRNRRREVNRMLLRISATDPKTGQRLEYIKNLHAIASQAILRMDKAVYRSGQNVKVTILAPKQVQRVFLDLVKSGQTLWTKSLSPKQRKVNKVFKLTKAKPPQSPPEPGRMKYSFDLAQDLQGTFELHAYHINSSGTIYRTARIFQVTQEQQLKISTTLDKASYKPGEKAVLQLQVKDAKGKPKQAALSLTAVDEAVFALYNLRPDLEAVYFALQKELLKPRVQSRAAFPMSFQQAVQPVPQQTEEVEEAKKVLFALAQPVYQTAVTAGKSYIERQQAVRLGQKRHVIKLYQVLLLALAGLFCVLLFFLIFVVYIRNRIPQASPEVKKLSKKYRLIWFFGLYFPPLVVLGISLVVNNFFNYSVRHDLKEYIMTGLCLSVLIVFFTLKVLNKRLFSQLPQESPNSLAWSWHIRPYLFLSAYLLLTLPLFLVRDPSYLMSKNIAITMFIGVPIALFLSWGMFSLIAHRQGESQTLGKTIWRFISRSIGPALPLLVVLFVIPMMMRFTRMSAPGRVYMSALTKSASKSDTDRQYNKKSYHPSDSSKAQNAPNSPKVRKYFPETLLWLPQLITDSFGKAKVTIPLADSITTWRLKASAVSAQGELGATTSGIRVFQPFFVDINLPSQLTQNDETAVNIAIFNYSKKAQTVRLEVPSCDWCTLLNRKTKTVRLQAQEVSKVSFRIKALKPGNHRFLVKAIGQTLSDAIERVIKVHPDGRKVVKTTSGELQKNQTHSLQYPPKAITGASQLSLKIYPGLFSQVVEGMDKILRMPYGCFEQTSSTTYPNLLVLDYLRKTKKTKPALEMKALRFLRLGYQRLTSFEVSGGGFSLYGKSPASVILTAYGLMEFKDMSKVTYIDPDLIQRTRAWLLRQQKADGSWKSYRKTNGTAYIAWALAESGETSHQLTKALDYLSTEERIQSALAKNHLTYISLTANALLAAGKTKQALQLLERIAQKVQKNKAKAFWASKDRGVFYSYGKSLNIEVTALVTYAMLKARVHSDLVNKAVSWLISQKDPNGTWYTTQATILTLRTLLASAEAGQKTKETMKATIIVNGKAAHEFTITPEQSDVMRFLNLNNYIKAGENKVTIESAGKDRISYQLVQTHYLPHTELFSKMPQQPMLSLKTEYSTQRLRVDETVTCTVSIRSNSKRLAHLPLLTLGIPPGFAIVREDLQKLVGKGRIDRFSVTERQLTIYMRVLRPSQTERLAYRLKARFPVKAQIPAGKAYLYYQPEQKAQTTPAQITVY